MFKNLNPQAVGLSVGQSELIELVLSNGFKGIDLDIVDFAEQAKTHGLPKARRLIDSAKLQIGGFQAPIELDNDEATVKASLEAFKPLAEMAAEIGCKRCWIHVAPTSDEQPYHANFETHRKRLIETAKLLDPLGITLAVGYHALPEAEPKRYQFVQDPEALLMLLGMVPAKNVGMLIDLWELHVSGSSLEAIRPKLKPQQVAIVWIADMPADMDPRSATQADRLLPNETKSIDSTAALVHLLELGYKGPITPWPSPARLNGVRRDEVVKRVGTALDTVWKEAGVVPLRSGAQTHGSGSRR